MNAVAAPAPVAIEIPLIPGTPFAGGFYAGRIRVDDKIFALIVAPRLEGEREDIAWNKGQKEVAGAMSFFDGRSNTAAMAEAGSKLAQWALELRIAGHDDWYLPSRDELEVIYRALKPTDEPNFGLSGDNPSSIPVMWAYFPNVPPQTSADAFREGGAEAFVDTWYWSSTQSAGDESYAWSQPFNYGYQGYYRKGLELRARAVRRLPLE